MTEPSTLFVALLRAVNLGSHNRVPMPELRALCEELGWLDAETYIQSGNVVFRAPAGSAVGRSGGGASPESGATPPGGREVRAQQEHEVRLEEAIRGRFGLDVPVVVRGARAWRAYVEGNPFPDASEREPNRVMMILSKAAPAPGAGKAIEARAVAGERVRLVGDALWIHYPEGQGRSKITPALVDRALGSPATSRNWRTVLRLRDMLEERAG